jgi:hypothetical protein
MEVKITERMSLFDRHFLSNIKLKKWGVVSDEKLSKSTRK